MLVDAFAYTGPSLLNQFFCDNAIIDKTLFYENKRFVSVNDIASAIVEAATAYRSLRKTLPPLFRVCKLIFNNLTNQAFNDI